MRILSRILSVGLLIVVVGCNSGTATGGGGGAVPTGGLSLVATVNNTGKYPEGMVITANSEYAYILSSVGINMYSVTSSGNLTPLSSQPVATGSNSIAITINPNESNLYVVNNGDNTIGNYTIASNGTLNLVATTSIAPESQPYTVAVSPSGHNAYVWNINGGVYTIMNYMIESNGVLASAATSTITTVQGASYHPVELLVNANYLYALSTDTSGHGIINMYSVGQNGVLTALNPATVQAQMVPAGFVLTTNNSYAYVVNNLSNTISMYSIQANGQLNALNPATTTAGGNPVDIAINPNNQYLYVLNVNSRSVSAYTINSGNGQVTNLKMPTVTTGTGSTDLIISPNGLYAYVLNDGSSGSTTVFAIKQ